MDDNKHVLNEISVRIKKVREDLGFSPGRMAGLFGITRSGYVKYEAGDSYPRPRVISKLARDFDISLDWLIAGKGPMHYKEKEQPETKPEPEPVSAEVKELIRLIELVPVLRYKVLALFAEFKVDRGDLVQAALNPPDEGE